MQERAVKTRARILKTAQRLFASHGYHGVNVDRIAAAAGANKQRIYEYFRNKKGLFEACLVEAFTEAGKEEAVMLKQISDDGGNMTAVILEHYMRLHKQQPDFWKLISWVNLEAGDFYKCLKNIKDDSYSKLGIYYRNGQECGVFSQDLSFEEYMFFLFSVTYFYHSNQKTLSNTLSKKLFSREGQERIISKCVAMLSKA
ncbi:MAG: TetR family transcriptional regulator [Victivallales bacterium]|nr:TetR family transcriptional regulator [Victivallales bacterium]